MDKKTHVVATIGGPETEAGTAVARTARLPITGLPSIKVTPSKQADGVITGRNTSGKQYTDAIEVTGELPLKFIPCAGVGMGLCSLLGRDETPKKVGAAILLTYTGEEESCKIAVSDTGGTISSSIGKLGSEVADAAFGTGGVEDLSAETVTTVFELVSVLNSYPGYTAVKLFGSDTASTLNPVAITAAQGKERQVAIFFTDESSSVYLHRISNVIGLAERPTYSVQIDGVLDNQLESGAVVDGASISAELKGRASISFSTIGLGCVSGQQASELNLPTGQPMRFYRGSTFIGGKEHSYVKSFSLDVKNNHDSDEGYGQGSLYKQEHVRGEFTASGSFTVRTTADSKAEHQKVLDDSISSALAIFKGGEYAAEIPELAIIDIPALQYTEGSVTESGIALDLQFSYQVIDRMSYDPMIQVFLLTQDAGRYDA